MKTDCENQKFAAKPKIITRFIAGETLLVPIAENLSSMKKIFALNPVGAFIWETLDGKAGFDTICEGIISRFDVSQNEAALDLKTFLNELNDAGLVETVD